MTGFRIEDGGGNGREALVNADKRLETYSITLPNIQSASDEGNAYSIIGRRTLASSSAENVLWFQNNNTNKHVHVETLFLAAKTTNGVLFSTYFNGAYTSGGTAKTPVQLNRSSAKTASVTAYENSGTTLVVSTASLVEFFTTRIGTTDGWSYNSQGAFILGPGDNFLLRATGTSGDLIEATVLLFEMQNI